MIRFASRVALIALPVFLASPLAARAQVAWRQVYKDPDVTVLLDTASLSLQSASTWTTVTSWDYARPRILENKKAYSRLVERVYLRCSPVRVKRVRSTVYTANNQLVRDEGEVDQRDQAHMVWDRPKGGTAGKNAFDAVCGVIAKRSVPAAKTAPKQVTARKTTTR